MEDYNLESKIMIPEKKGNFWGNIITFCLLFLSITIPKIVSAIYPRLDYEGAALQRMKSSLIPSFGIFLLLAYFSFFYKKPLRYIFLFLFGVIATIGLIFSMRGALGSLSAVLVLSDERLNIEARYFSKEIYLVGTFFFLTLRNSNTLCLTDKKKVRIKPKENNYFLRSFNHFINYCSSFLYSSYHDSFYIMKVDA